MSVETTEAFTDESLVRVDSLNLKTMTVRLPPHVVEFINTYAQFKKRKVADMLRILILEGLKFKAFTPDDLSD